MTTRYKFRLPAAGEPGYENNRSCSTTTNKIAPGDKCHRRPVRWKIARTREATTGVRFACDDCARPYAEASA